MTGLFVTVVGMSAVAGYVILLVLPLRLLLRKMPKAICCALWCVVLIRLLCPVSFESVLSLLAVSPPGRSAGGGVSTVHSAANRRRVTGGR